MAALLLGPYAAAKFSGTALLCPLYDQTAYIKSPSAAITIIALTTPLSLAICLLYVFKQKKCAWCEGFKNNIKMG